ncbi:MAG: hypothetical protein ACK41T_11705 [Pseudobdellovibrio sp.]
MNGDNNSHELNNHQLNDLNSSSASQISIENSTQQVHRELSLKEITSILMRNWPLFVVLFITFSLIGVSYYKWANPYVARVTIIINDTQNSQLHSFTGSLTGGIAKTNEAKKSNSSVQKQIEYFRTAQFFQELIKKSQSSDYKKNLSLSEKSGEKIYNDTFLGKDFKSTEEETLRASNLLDKAINFKVTSDYEIEVSVKNDNQDLALYIVNLASDTALSVLKSNDTHDIKSMNEFLLNEKDLVEKELAEINKKMTLFNDKPENLMALSSTDKVGEYLSELLIRKNETLLKINENNKIIKTLAPSGGITKESMLYGNNGRVQALKIENDLLKSKLSHIQVAIDKVSREAKGMPAAAQVYEELKKRSDIQLAKFKDVVDSLKKIDALKLAADNRYEIFEKARLDKVIPQVSLLIIGFLVVLLSQAVGSFIIYIKAIWDSNIITAQATRNVLVVDSHSLDPRVIIENSKIKFRLRDSYMYEDDPERGRTKKLGFNFKNKG